MRLNKRKDNEVKLEEKTRDDVDEFAYLAW